MRTCARIEGCECDAEPCEDAGHCRNSRAVCSVAPPALARDTDNLSYTVAPNDTLCAIAYRDLASPLPEDRRQGESAAVDSDNLPYERPGVLHIWEEAPRQSSPNGARPAVPNPPIPGSDLKD